ncbi:MAG: VapC toxin family PIN domain ribonuclease [Arcobacter sp.]|nr:MAG: VapC toxin family PIN domain ribonuclease [Arcobacter sp.]
MIYDKLFDTDVLIWYLKGNKKAYDLVHKSNFCISSITYMELVQGMRNKEELRLLKRVLKQWNIKIIFVNEEISSKALFFVEEYFLSHSMLLADALIGSTASLYGLKLVTANDKHYKVLKDVELEVFRA